MIQGERGTERTKGQSGEREGEMEVSRRDEAMRVGEDRDRNTWRGRGRDGQRKTQGGYRDKGEKGPGTERGRWSGWRRDRLMETQNYKVIRVLIHSFPGKQTDEHRDELSGPGPEPPTCCCPGMAGWWQRLGDSFWVPCPAQPHPGPSPGAQPLRTRLLLVLPPPSPPPTLLPRVCLSGSCLSLSVPLFVSVSMSLSLCSVTPVLSVSFPSSISQSPS